MKQSRQYCQSDPYIEDQSQKQKDEILSDSSIDQPNLISLPSKQFLNQSVTQQNKRDFIVTTGLNLQITDYFKFENRQQLQKEKTIFKDLNQQSYITWIILLFSVISNAMVPPWLMSINADKLLRMSWKCFLQCVTIIPFVLYQMRSKNQKNINQYKVRHIFKLKHLKKVWVLAFTSSFWPTTILTTIQWTYISHCFVLGSLTNLFLSFQRLWEGKAGRMENGGQIIAVLGIIFVIYDSISLDVSTATDYEWNVYNPFYLTRKWWQRVLSDLGAITVGYCMSQLSKKTSDIKQYYPPYLLLFLNNFFTCIFMIFSAYFFNGATFDTNSQWGVFALFSAIHFTNFLYLAILLGMNVFVTFSLISKLFPDPVIIAIAMTMQPIISTILWDFVGVQKIPGPFACFGYMLIIPGIITILTGNCLQTRSKKQSNLSINKPLIQTINEQKEEENEMKQDQSTPNKQY